MDKTLQAMVVVDDPALFGEFELALDGYPTDVVLEQVLGLRRGVEAVRNRQPDVVFVQMPSDHAELRASSEEMRAAAPDAVLIGVFDPSDGSGHDGDFLIRALRANLRDFLRRPVSSRELAEVLGRYTGAATPAAEGGRGRLVSFVGNKGGVGKTTLAVNTACLAARGRPGRVLLIDASLQLGQCASLLDLPDSTPSIADAVQDLAQLDPTLLRELVVRHDSGLDLLAAPPDPVVAADVGAEALSRVLGVARRGYDLVVVDSFPLLDATTIAILDRSDLAYVVVANSVPTVLGGVRLLEILERVGVPLGRQRVVLNSVHPRHAAELSLGDVAARLGREVDHHIPFEKELLVAANTGDPLGVRVGRRFRFGKALHGLVDDMQSGTARRSVARLAASGGSGGGEA